MLLAQTARYKDCSFKQHQIDAQTSAQSYGWNKKTEEQILDDIRSCLEDLKRYPNTWSLYNIPRRLRRERLS